MSRKTLPPAEDAALWQQVTAHVRPLGRTTAPPDPPARPPVHVQQRRAEPPAPPQGSARSPAGASLDGGWDRRIRSGKLMPDATIDLHGHSLLHAHEVLAGAIRRAFAHHLRVLLIITGKGQRFTGDASRATIRASLPVWLEAPDLRGFIASVRPAHPRHGGAGALYVILRRQRAP